MLSIGLLFQFFNGLIPLKDVKFLMHSYKLKAINKSGLGSPIFFFKLTTLGKQREPPGRRSLVLAEAVHVDVSPL